MPNSHSNKDAINEAIKTRLDRGGFDPAGLLNITIANRLNNLTDHDFVKAFQNGTHINV